MERVQLEFPGGDVVHRYPLSVRIGDMNYGRHLGHDALLGLLHEARAQAFVALGFREWDVAGHTSVVADLAVQYRGEAKWPDTLEAETAIPRSQGRGLSVYQRLHRPTDERTIAVARMNLVLLDPATGRPVAVPDAVNEALDASRQQGSD
ncbi:Acyl-CoA thioesterase FadM [Modicisalibacter ilicicola DSM 19980]|uniref:Acyl-CoA thioesterase FadM n=1 Tax=Modicisalibacter ilicicola DSM 19980 TaxID=1121942 RepID=A0A1M4UGR7_9GAMM|nr:thioesterase family protein [Halomonas ilicicola]SHE55828.1 Acyl-CoA thioesterase FadM [Halomonas ilicicola DSM 19980]